MPPEESQEPLTEMQSLLTKLAEVDLENLKLQQIWHTIDQLQVGEANWQQLQQFGEVFLQVADLYARRADLLLTDWEERHDPIGPPLVDDLLEGLVQKTMFLDLSDLTRQPNRRSRGKRQSNPDDNPSIVQSVDKEKVLAFVQVQEQSIEAKAKALAVAHDEDVLGWIGTIERWIKSQSQRQKQFTLVEVQQGTHLPIVKLWLALLLAEPFVLEQTGDFYEGSSIVVRYLA